MREGQEREAHQGGGHKDRHIHAEDGSGAQGEETESRMRGCGAGRNISRARSSRSINSALCDYFSRHAPHTPSLLDIFPFVGTQTARYLRRRLTPWWVGHWSSSKRPHPHLRTWGVANTRHVVPARTKSYLPRVPHPLSPTRTHLIMMNMNCIAVYDHKKPAIGVF